MPDQNREVAPGPDGTWFRTKTQLLRMPQGWELLPPGDAALTRRVKEAGPSWVVSEKRGNKVFSRGVCAPKDRIERIRQELAIERSDPSYAKKLEQGRRRRAVQQVEYVGEFSSAVRTFLAFAPSHAELGQRLAEAIAAHATPVGSGTVARTQRIPVEERAEAATIAWLRHQTTGYDDMQIARVKGLRREVRRELAQRSRELLSRYRRGDAVDPSMCPLRRALDRGQSVNAS
jgi:hypothetical protein